MSEELGTVKGLWATNSNCLAQVASQFRIILANMNTQFTGIFGHIIYGIEALDKVANIGGEGGRPEKVAMVANCGVYKI